MAQAQTKTHPHSDSGREPHLAGGLAAILASFHRRRPGRHILRVPPHLSPGTGFRAACPITVKRALSRVDGVESVAVDFNQKQATVVFDDARTTVQALTQATENAGFPSSPQLSGESS